jgi:hypothetical protein
MPREWRDIIKIAILFLQRSPSFGCVASITMGTGIAVHLFKTCDREILRVTQAWDNFDFFLPLHALYKFLKKISLLFLRFSPEFRCSNISSVTEHMRNQIFSWAIQNFFSKSLVLLDGFLDGFWKFRLFIVKICILIGYFWVFFKNYSMRMLSKRGNNFIASRAYGEPISSHTEHTRNEFHRMLSISRTDFIVCWACAEMFKSRISWPNRIRFSKISCYRPSGPYGFGFCKKSI